jgi:hypothetical protein
VRKRRQRRFITAMVFPNGSSPQVLKRLTGLEATQSALTQSFLRAGTGKGPVAQWYRQLRIEIRLQEAVNTDDTGWRIGGYLVNLMAFDSRMIAVYQIRSSIETKKSGK